MDAMRSAAVFFIAALFIIPSTAFGVEVAKPKCFMKNVKDPSSTKTFSLSSDSDEIEAHMQNVVMCPTACYDESILFDVRATGISIVVRATNKCGTDTPTPETAKKYDRGCEEGMTPPRVNIKITGLQQKTLPTKSRCDTSASTTGFATAGQAKSFATQAVIADRIAGIDVSTEDGRGQLSQILRSYGVSETDANAKVSDADKAADVQAQLQKFVSTSDTDEAKQVASDLGLKLNEDLTDTVRLDPKRYAAIFTEEELARVQSGVPDTFGDPQNPDAPNQPDIAASVAPMCSQQGMGGCGYACSLPNPNLLTCAANNPGALTFTSWQTKYGGRPCGLPNNTTCYDTVEGGIAAQANLLMTSPRYFGTGNNTILGAFCGGYTANKSQCAPYAAFISAQTGIPMNQTIDPRNTEQIAAIMMASSRFENGRGVIYTPEQLQKGLQIAFGNEPLPAGTPGYIPRTMYGTGGGTQFGSMFSVGPAAAPAPATIGYGSPFAQTSPAPTTGSSASIASPSTQPSSYTQISQQLQQTQNPNGSSSVAQQLQQALGTSTPTSSSAIATIITQPKEVPRGNPITVAWSSVGMSADIPCALRMGTNVIALKNEGSSIIPTSQSTPVGSLVFTLTCTAVSGQTIQRTAATFVR